MCLLKIKKTVVMQLKADEHGWQEETSIDLVSILFSTIAPVDTFHTVETVK